MIKHTIRGMARGFISQKKNPLFGKPLETVISTGEELVEYLRKEGIAVNVPASAQTTTTSDADLKALQRRQKKLESQSTELEPLPLKRETPIEPVRGRYEKELLKNFTTGDETLNQHVFGNIPMKLVNF
jgi:hypothetical protein